MRENIYRPNFSAYAQYVLSLSISFFFLSFFLSLLFVVTPLFSEFKEKVLLSLRLHHQFIRFYREDGQ